MADGRVTLILSEIHAGDPTATDRLLPVVYDQLRQLAAGRLRQERPGQTLQATALVHEAYLRLVGADHRWDGRGHFFVAAAEAMRRILIERARARGAVKRGGGRRRLTLGDCPIIDGADGIDSADGGDLLDLDDALQRLVALDPRKAALVKLRFFAGLTLSQAAAALGISDATADRDWAFARAWLFSELAERGEPDD